jgi:LacI family transcriptional regulator
MAQVTLKDVSQAVGVSVQTVSQILNPRYRSLYHPRTREKVMQAAKDLGYRPSAAARAMISRRSHIIGVLVPIIPHGWFFQLDVFETMLGMNERLAREGYVTSVIPVKELQSGGSASRAFREQLLDGVVVIGWVPEEIGHFVEEVAPACIWCDTNVDRPRGCIRRDEFYSGQLAAERVIGRGYRRILWLTYESPSSHYSGPDRLRGIEQAAGRHGVPVQVVRCTQSWVDDDPAPWAGLLRPDTAVLTEHMHFAQSLVNLVQPMGLAAGRDFGLAACDHSHERAAVFPGVSRVMIDRARIGLEAGEMMLEALASGSLPASRVFRGEWYEGSTTRRRYDDASAGSRGGIVDQQQSAAKPD